MKLQEKPKYTTGHIHPRHAVRRRVQTLLGIIAALAILTVGLGIFHTLTVIDYRAEADAMAGELDTLHSQIAVLESQQAANSSRLAEQDNTISSLEEQAKEQEEKLKEQEKTIAAQKKAIAALKKVTTTKANATTTKKTTTTAKPKKTTVAVTASKKDKLIALTFDDGPSTATTGKLLDALQERGAKATFFVLGSCINNETAPLLKRMEAEGHAVGNHSQNHKNLRYQSASGIKAEMNTAAKKIKAVLGHYPTIMRCPGGNYDDEVKAYAQSAGVSIIQWSVDTRDWESRNVKSILNTAFNNSYSKIQDGAIMLMHDIYPTTVEAAIQMVDRLQKEGYTLVTVPELLTLRGGGAAAGQVYNSAA